MLFPFQTLYYTKQPKKENVKKRWNEKLTGHMNANITHEKAPERLMNKPNLGILWAKIPDIIIMIVLKIMFFKYG